METRECWVTTMFRDLESPFQKMETPGLETLLENKDNFVTFSLSEFVAERKRVQGL